MKSLFSLLIVLSVFSCTSVAGDAVNYSVTENDSCVVCCDQQLSNYPVMSESFDQVVLKACSSEMLYVKDTACPEVCVYADSTRSWYVLCEPSGHTLPSQHYLRATQPI